MWDSIKEMFSMMVIILVFSLCFNNLLMINKVKNPLLNFLLLIEELSMNFVNCSLSLQI
ncbi:hypothetical protein Goarm_003223 [Gossypium armourianum]|uniref:Uncharacterized protein n=1 Tax=Gossypium armourianum TaxID=34283 RepID=A0A7J9K2K3_9ROSI|nr:hypothetical protein [Gossypium armourianum]